MKIIDTKDLVEQYGIVRIQEAELEKEIKRLMQLSFRLSVKADNLRQEFKDITGNWLDHDGKIVEINKPINWRFPE
ncbi:MAG: hypothetical protein KGJ07_00525 [Patescibacteria group bacterium]|nr:hypothetical protein [Patescibacteria group bacterium]